VKHYCNLLVPNKHHVLQYFQLTVFILVTTCIYKTQQISAQQVCKIWQ